MSPTPDPNFVVLYVKDVSVSAAFYAGLLGRAPVESSPNFAMFAQPSGLTLGLWAKKDVVPVATVTGGGGELCIRVKDADAVRSTHADWSGRGLEIIQVPTE